MSRNLKTHILTFALVVAFSLALTSCASDSQSPIPTRTPAPTFTPKPPVEQAPVDPVAAATARAAQPIVEQPVAPVGDQPVVQPPAPPADTPIPEPPTPEPAAAAEVVINTNMNVRGGPGTNYNVIGSANSGESYPVRGKDNASSWWQIDFRGQLGWVFGDLVTAQNTGSVAVAQNIPAAPPTQPPAPPTQPPAPVATQPPAPPPEPSYQFNKAVVGRCDPNEGVTYVHGKTYRGGQPQSGYMVAFSYASDGPIVAKVESGPHQGYPGWDQGYYSHILQANGMREGDWFFWIVDDSDKRISKIAHVHTDGSKSDTSCQQAIIDFDS